MLGEQLPPPSISLASPPVQSLSLELSWRFFSARRGSSSERPVQAQGRQDPAWKPEGKSSLPAPPRWPCLTSPLALGSLCLSDPQARPKSPWNLCLCGFHPGHLSPNSLSWRGCSHFPAAQPFFQSAASQRHQTGLGLWELKHRLGKGDKASQLPSPGP